jgi:hypothetical protein
MHVSTDEQATRHVHHTVHIYHDINYVYTRHELFGEIPGMKKNKNGVASICAWLATVPKMVLSPTMTRTVSTRAIESIQKKMVETETIGRGDEGGEDENNNHNSK